MATKTKAPKEHPDQQHMPGLEPERNVRIHGAAKAYKKVRDARMTASAAEKVGKDKLIEVMKEEGMDVYQDPSGYIVTLNGVYNVKLADEERGGDASEE
jgi:hypothetical protein